MSRLKVFIISLQTAIERRKKIKENIKLEYEFFDAINVFGKKGIVKKIIDRLLLNNKNKDYSIGAIGCAISHRILLKKLINDVNNDYYLILEDDVDLKKSVIHILRDVNNIFKKNDCDVLFLGASDGNSVPNILKISSINIKYGIIAEPIDKTLFCTYGYVISNKGAKKIVKQLDSRIPIDYWGLYKTKDTSIKYLCVYPNAILPNILSQHSTIGNKKSQPKNYLLRLIYNNLETIIK